MQNPGFLKRAFKIKFGLKLCLLTIAGMLAVTLSLYFMTAKPLGDSYGRAIYAIYDLKIRIFPLVFASFYSIFILALVTAAIALISVFFSHKIAGPIFRIERNLEVIGGGDLTVYTKFRGNDQLETLADEINLMVRSLNHTVRSSKDALYAIQRCEEKLEAVLKKGAPAQEEMLEVISELRISIEDLKKVTSAFKVAD
ncbi:MAG: methyl-accepting chemotaxis protein [Deltaproteobacteria bacterium]|nr:methyl-accepting chemotaxis protein [Deltaproteobacteria bacterium]